VMPNPSAISLKTCHKLDIALRGRLANGSTTALSFGLPRSCPIIKTNRTEARQTQLGNCSFFNEASFQMLCVGETAPNQFQLWNSNFV
jgi:hypothetical protein